MAVNQNEDLGGTGATSGGGWEIQDRRTGAWRPYPQYDDGIGNIRSPDGTAYAHDGGAAAYQQSLQVAPVPAEPPPPDPIAGAIIDAAQEVSAGAGDGGGGVVEPPPYVPTGGGVPTVPTAGGGGGLINPYPGGDFTPPPVAEYRPPAFAAPSWEEAANDPGFQFAQQEGQKGVERSAAARGVLNSGGTLQDIAKWNQALATTQYGNVYDRALGRYNTNYTTQYLDPYKNAYQSALQKYQTNYQSWLDRINQSKDIAGM